jgi:menaquinone-dependent protoporphyrinogen IX oxidase
MLLIRTIILPATLLFSFPSWATDTLDVTPDKVLFVYDTITKPSAFYVETIRENLEKESFQVDEASSSALRQKDPSQYHQIVIYGMVMAFNMKSSVRSWLKSQKNLENKKVFIFVTANRWFDENLRKDLAKLATKKNATVVDAVSMATNKVSDAEKREKMTALIAQVKK